MKICILSKEQQPEIYEEAYKMLEAADKEFVPPLSMRESSTQQSFSAGVKGDSIVRYFEQLKDQRFAAVFHEEALIAFVSYKENYTCGQIPPEELPNIYLSTLVVSPKARGKGVTKALYSKLFSEYEAVNIFTRTWSTNIAHIRILERFGFEVVGILENDRGNGVHTVYFKKCRK
jgi:ribosomal protein S18 acetylase RimI-like enzyme